MTKHTDVDLSPEEEKQLILRVIEYAKKHHRVTISQISKELNLDETDDNYLLTSLVTKMNRQENPNHILAAVNRPKSNVANDDKEDEYQLLPTAVFSFIDYLEIKEARKHATEARRQSLTAIKIAVLSLIVSAVLGIVAIIVQIIFRP